MINTHIQYVALSVTIHDLISRLFNEAVLTAEIVSYTIKWNVKLKITGELAIIWKQALVDFLKVPSRLLTTETEKNFRLDIW